MKIKGIMCPCCDTVIYSRALHDFRKCKNSYSAVDGGQRDYIKVTWGMNGKELGIPKQVEIELDVTLQDIGNDYTWNIGNYGYVKVEDAKQLKYVHPRED